MSELNASDVLAMTRNNGEGFLEGNGIIILILFFLIFGFGGGGFGNNSAWQNSMTRAELSDGLNTQDIKREIGDIQMQMCNGFSSVNTNILGGVNTLQNNLCAGFNSVNSNIAQLGFNMQQCCCDLKTTIHDEGEQTRALIQANLIQDLRDKLADKDRELLTTGLVTAQTIQTNNLESYIRNVMGGCGCNA